MRKQSWVSGGIVIVAVIVAVGVIYGQPLLSYIKDQRQGAVVAIPSEEGKQASGKKFSLPEGRQTYRVVQAGEVWPKILEAVIDPPDVHVGDKQKLTLVVQGPDPIVSVEARTELDHGLKVIPLKLVGEVAESELAPLAYGLDDDNRLVALASHPPRSEGSSPSLPAAQAADVPAVAHAEEGHPRLKYEAEWTVYDTHETTYRTIFVAKDAKGRENDITLAWSDACNILMSGAWSSSDNCTINAPDGVEGGNVTVSDNQTLTLNAGFAFNSGYSVTINPLAAIAIGSGGSLIQTNIWVYDGDSDGYTDSSQEMRLQAADPDDDVSLWDRRSVHTAIGDCNDASASVWQNIGNLAVDSDNEGYYAGSSGTQCVGNAQTLSGRTYYTIADGTYYVAIASAVGGNDCDDANALAWQSLSLEPDYDRDGLTEGAAVLRCVGSPYCGVGNHYAISNNTFQSCGNTNPRTHFPTAQRTGTEAAIVCAIAPSC